MDAHCRRDQHEAGRWRRDLPRQGVEGVLQGQRGTGGVADHVDRPLAQRRREVCHGEAYGGGHVPLVDVPEPGGRGAVAGHAQADHPVAPARQLFRQGAQAVGRVRHAVQQERAGHRRLGALLEAAVPVVLHAPRVGRAAGAVAHQILSGTGVDLGVDLLLELGEEPVLEQEVVVEAPDLVELPGVELLVELGREPGGERCVAAGDGQDRRHGQGSRADHPDHRRRASHEAREPSLTPPRVATRRYPRAGRARPSTLTSAVGRKACPQPTSR